MCSFIKVNFITKNYSLCCLKIAVQVDVSNPMKYYGRTFNFRCWFQSSLDLQLHTHNVIIIIMIIMIMILPPSLLLSLALSVPSPLPPSFPSFLPILLFPPSCFYFSLPFFPFFQREWKYIRKCHMTVWLGWFFILLPCPTLIEMLAKPQEHADTGQHNVPYCMLFTVRSQCRLRS